MMMIRGALIRNSILIIVLTLLTTSASCYEIRVHQLLSLTAFQISGVSEVLADTYGIGPSDLFRSRRFSLAGGPRTAAQWVRAGGAQEDVPFWRVVNHFYDPISNKGLDWAGGAPSPDWALEPTGPLDGQNHSYRDARDAFYQGLTASDSTTRERELG